jgi:hypothetical protein
LIFLGTDPGLATTAAKPGSVPKNIKGHVIDLGNGKTMTSHAATFVTQGYQSGPKMAELRRKSIEAASKSDKGYTPAAPKATRKTASAAPSRARPTSMRTGKPKTEPRKKSSLSKEQQIAAITNIMKGQGRDQGEINAALKNAGLS